MKRKSRKLCSLIVASSMVLSMSVSPVFGAQFEDTADHWASKQINTWSDYGVINGYEGLFRPNDPITRGEMAVIMNNIMQYRVKGTNTFKDLDYGFYRDAILKASNAGVMNGSDGLVRPKDNITREESAILICNTMGIDSSDSSSQTFDDSGDISSWAKPYVNALLNKGYISGKGDNNFDPQGYITRGETVTILDNIVKGFYNSAGTYTQNADGTVVVNSADAVLKNMNITGDLIISEGVGDGDIILEDVTLGGALIVRGGGENSIHFRGSKTQIPNVKMEKKDGNVRLATDGQAKVGNVLVKDKSKEVKLEGTFTSVNVSSTNIVRVQKANITKLSVDTEKANVRVDSNSTVETLEVPANAESSELYIEGNVKNLQTLAKSVKLQTTTSSIIETLTVSESASNADINLSGKVNNTNISASGIKFVVNKSAVMTNITVSVSVVGINFEIIGTITTLTTHGTDIKINVASTGTISTITASESSSNITISGSGKVEQVYANGSNITITTGGTQVTTGSNATGVVVNNVKVESNKTIVTTGQNGGITNPTDNNNSGSSSTDVAAGAKTIIGEINNRKNSFANVKIGDNILDMVKAQIVGVSNYSNYDITINTSDSSVIDTNGIALKVGQSRVKFTATSKTNSKNTATSTEEIVINVSENENAISVTARVYEASENGFSFTLTPSVTGINVKVGNEYVTATTNDGGKTYFVNKAFKPGTYTVEIFKAGYSFNPFSIIVSDKDATLVNVTATPNGLDGFKLTLNTDVNLTVNDITISNANITDVVPVDGKTYNVATSKLQPNTKYTVTITKPNYSFTDGGSTITFTTLDPDAENYGAQTILNEIISGKDSFINVKVNNNILELAKAVTNTNEYNITMTSSDETVISNDGVALKEGTADVTFTVTSQTNEKDTATSEAITITITGDTTEDEKPKVEITSVNKVSSNSFEIVFSTPVENLSKEDIILTKDGETSPIAIISASPDSANSTYTVVTESDLVAGTYTVTLSAEKYAVTKAGTFTVEDNTQVTDKVTVEVGGNGEHKLDETNVWYGVYGNTVNNTVGNAVYARVYLKPVMENPYTIESDKITLNFDVLSELKVSNPNPELTLDLSTVEFNLLNSDNTVARGNIKIDSSNGHKVIVEVPLSGFDTSKEFTLELVKIGDETITNELHLTIKVTKATN